MKRLYNVRVSVVSKEKRQLYNALLYKSFRRALADSLDGIADIYDNVPDEYIPAAFDCPTMITAFSTDKKGKPDDFEIRYEVQEDIMLIVYIGKAYAFDK